MKFSKPNTPPYSFITLILKTLGITILAFILSIALEAPFTASTSAIFSTPEKNDFTMPDMYAQIADNRPVRRLDDKVVLIDIGLAGRNEIADALQLLSLTGTKAIGLDINFLDPHDNDEKLLNVISQTPNIVLPVGMESDGNNFKLDEIPFFYGTLDNPVYGAANLPVKGEKGSIREYKAWYPTTTGDTIAGFSTALAKIAYPQAYEKLAERFHKAGADIATTSYHSREYKIYNIDEIEEKAEEFSDKIVILGALGDAYDMHATPINSYMPGMMIHAYILSTILDGKWYVNMPKYMDYLLAFIICFLIVLLTVGIKKGYRGALVRVLQVVLAYAAVRIGYHLFIDRQIVCNFTHTLLMIAFGLFAFDIWNGLEYLIKTVGTRRRKRIIEVTES